MKLIDLVRRIPRAILFRIEMRVRHALDTWAAQQHLFAQVNLLDLRTDLIEHRIVSLADRLEQHASLTQRQIADIAQLLAQIHTTAQGSSSESLQMHLAPLEARMVRLGRDVSSVRTQQADAAMGLADIRAHIGAVNEGIGDRFNNIGVRLDGLATPLQVLPTMVGRFDSLGLRLDDLAAPLQILPTMGPRFDNLGVRLDDLATVLQAIPGIGDRFNSVGDRFDDLATVLRAAREENAQTGVNVNRQIEGIKVRFDGIDRRFDDVGSYFNGIESRVGAGLNDLQRAVGRGLSRQHIPLTDGFDAVHTPKGWIVVPREEFRSLIHLADGSAYHEPGTLHVVETLLEPGDIAIDVGAHIGLITVPMALKVGEKGRVVSLEPFPRSAEALRRGLALNGVSDQVTIQINAAADVAEETVLFTGATGMLASLYADEPSQPSIRITTVRLDDLIAPGDRVDMVKIDAEGAELAVLQGMARIVADNERLLVIAELGPSHLVRTGNTIQSWLAAFEGLGFAGAFEIDDEALALKPLRSAKQLEAVYSINVVFARQAGDARLKPLLAQGRAYKRAR